MINFKSIKSQTISKEKEVTIKEREVTIKEKEVTFKEEGEDVEIIMEGVIKGMNKLLDLFLLKIFNLITKKMKGLKNNIIKILIAKKIKKSIKKKLLLCLFSALSAVVESLKSRSGTEIVSKY